MFDDVYVVTDMLVELRWSSMGASGSSCFLYTVPNGPVLMTGTRADLCGVC